MKKLLLNQLLLWASLVSLSGFGTVESLLLAGFTANWLINEPRPISAVLEDLRISYEVSRKLSNHPQFGKHTHVAPKCYNRSVLLIGQVPDETFKNQATYCVKNTLRVKRVFNLITIGPPINLARRLKDISLKALIQGKLSLASDLRFHHFAIFTQDGSVFVLGKAESGEVERAASIIQNTLGVKEIITVVEPEE